MFFSGLIPIPIIHSHGAGELIFGADIHFQSTGKYWSQNV